MDKHDFKQMKQHLSITLEKFNEDIGFTTLTAISSHETDIAVSEIIEINRQIVQAHNRIKELAKQGITVKAQRDKIIAEEAPGAYKPIDQVVQVSHDLGIVKKVVKLIPIGVTKG